MEQFTPQDFEIYDMHAHIFPHKISEKATESIGQFYDITMHYSIGESERLLEAEQQIGTKRMLVCSVATTPKQVVSINNFIHEECEKHPEMIGFAALHGDFEDIAGEVDRVIAMGLHGIKLHADFQRTPIARNPTASTRRSRADCRFWCTWAITGMIFRIRPCLQRSCGTSRS